MARRSRKLPARRARSQEPAIADQVLDAPDATVLDLLDNLLNKGVMLNADVTLGVAGIDLIYLRLSALLAAFDRIFGESDWPATARSSRRARVARSIARRR
jgi:gas vesicle protein GvpA/GvpJ/GvpM family